MGCTDSKVKQSVIAVKPSPAPANKSLDENWPVIPPLKYKPGVGSASASVT